eukprot:TRINITY_DN960_c1_g1_i1.p1 TRINITY_DN960_c1_g1~~TRINITY_DN960_c1_g1_i1.p1  ORF type:complete len:980 (-),score=417.96 TRINITY_DN960_c1_g1_i1:169-3108(-)
MSGWTSTVAKKDRQKFTMTGRHSKLDLSSDEGFESSSSFNSNSLLKSHSNKDLMNMSSTPSNTSPIISIDDDSEGPMGFLQFDNDKDTKAKAMESKEFIRSKSVRSEVKEARPNSIMISKGQSDKDRRNANNKTVRASVRVESQINESKPRSKPASTPQAELKRLLEDWVTINPIASLSENSICADCSIPNPRWVSATFGCWLCSECALLLRQITGKIYADVRCIDLSFYSFGKDLALYLNETGNNKVSQILEAKKTTSSEKPDSNSDKTKKILWIDQKYSKLQFYKMTEGYANVIQIQGLSKTKKKLAWEKRYIRFSRPTALDLYETDLSSDSLEKIDLEICQIKDATEVDLPSYGVSKDIVIPPGTLFVALPQSIYLLANEINTSNVNSSSNSITPVNPSNSPGGLSWNYSLRIAVAVSQKNNSPDEEIQSSSGLSHPLLSSASMGQSSTSIHSENESVVVISPEYTTEKLMNLLNTYIEEKQNEIETIKAKLEPITAALPEKIAKRDELRKLVAEAQSKESDLEEKKQFNLTNLNELEPENPLLLKKVTAEDDNKGDSGGSSGLTLKEDKNERVVMAGTCWKLVQELTREGTADTEFLKTFMLTYRSFTNAEDLLDKLQKRFAIQPPPFIDEETKKKFFETRQKPIRLRVINVVKNWVTHHYYDFETNQQLVENLIDFLSNDVEPCGGAMKQSSYQLKKIIKRRIKGKNKDKEKVKENVVDESKLPQSILPSNLLSFTFDDLDPQELARQLALADMDLYKKIRPHELLNQAWNHKTLKEVAAPNILTYIRHFNRVSDWCCSTLVSIVSFEHRVRALNKFLLLAKFCKQFRNFNTLQAIIAGFSASPCHRLKKTWAACDPKLLVELEQIRSDLSRDNNFSSLRSIIKTESPPLTPYLGMYLTDLTFIEDGNPDKVSEGLINFAKRRRISEVIRQVQQYQLTPYLFKKVDEIYNFSCNLFGLPEAEAYSKSLVAEPRQ